MRKVSLLPFLLTAIACSGASRGDDPEGSGGTNVDVGATGGMGEGADFTGGASSGGAGSGGSATGGQGTLTGGASAGGNSGGAATGGDDMGTGGTPLAESPGGTAGAPPSTWKEHWFEHEQDVALVDYNDWVALYVDDDVNRNEIGWMMDYFTDVWRYTVTHYGQFTDGTRDGRVYMIFHQGRYSGGHPSTYFDESHDYRNVADQGPGTWADGSYDIPTHEIAHIVEGASRGHHGSPAFGIWKDSKWAEFYLYDVFVALGKDAAAERVYNDFSSKAEDYPQPGSYWFRDWFYPLWRDHGGVQVMANYFQLIADHSPGSLNFGEFVHFMSGAAGVNLKQMATTAFGWPAQRQTEFESAQAEFSSITYP